MLKIFCDETWTVRSDFSNVKVPTIVFYGVMLDEIAEQSLLQKIEAFKKQRGLLPPKNTPIEVKWQKVEDEWKGAEKSGKPNRYEGFLDIFFDEIASKRLSFGYMFLNKREYDEVEKGFLEKQNDNKQNFFFMLYFQFLYNCFVKNQVKQHPCEIWIDNHDMGGEGRQYEIGKLKEILNKKIYNEYTPKGQMTLSLEMKKQLVDSVHLVSLAESKNEPLVQLADLCAGCVRYIIENQVAPPESRGQLSLFESSELKELLNGKDSLTNYFYNQLRHIKGYSGINLQNLSYHHRFNIFPFVFGK
jgi:Protein of unknown function (DUF3800)